MNLYEWQKECLQVIKNKNAIISAPTGAGKTKVAYIWMDPKGAKEGKHKIIYTVPIKALANEKADELRSIYGREMVGIETGDVKKNENAPILVCTQEIYTLKYARKKQKIKLVIDEFHYIFSDNHRTRSYIDGIKHAKDSHQILIMSATLSKPDKIKQYLTNTTGKDFVLYQTDFRPTKLTFTKQVFSLDDIPPHSLIYVFNTYMIDRMARHLSAKYPPLDLLKRRKIRLLAIDYRINPDKFPEIFHGIARYHSKLTYTEKRFIERLVREGYIHTLLATSALGVGVNLPFKWVLFGSLTVHIDGKDIPISKIDFVQLSGRAGRVGYFDEGYVGVLEHGFTQEDTVDLYRKLLSKELEEPQIKLEIDVWSVVKGERTLEEEVEYVCRYSLPERDRQEVLKEAQEIEKKLSSISEKEREFLREFYQPDISLDENLRLAKFITHKVGDPIEIHLFALPVGRKEKEIDYLLLLRRIGRRLNGQKWEGREMQVKDMQEVENQIKALDPLVLEVLT